MSSDERQEAIWDIILQRKFETVPNIADELGVCTRTVCLLILHLVFLILPFFV